MSDRTAAQKYQRARLSHYLTLVLALFLVVIVVSQAVGGNPSILVFLLVAVIGVVVSTRRVSAARREADHQ